MEKWNKDLGQFIRDERKRTGSNIQYLLIPEQHKDNAWHIHGLIKGIPKEELVINKYGYRDWLRYSKKFGYCSIDKVKSQIAVSKYITKYVSKSLSDTTEREKEKKLYYNSRGLKRAIKVNQGTLPSFELERIPRDYENDYVVSKMLNYSEYVQLTEQLFEYNYSTDRRDKEVLITT